MINPSSILSYSTTLSQPSISNGPFTITGSNSSSAPVVINLISDLTITSASSLFSSTSGNWIFNGNGHTITVSGVSNFTGLFSSINSGGVVENISFVSSNGSTLATYSGAVAATSSGLIDHINSNFSVSSWGGGIVGAMTVDGVVANSKSTGEISGIYAGGIVGIGNAGVVHDSCSTGVISGPYAGGIASLYNTGAIYNSYSTGNLLDMFAGGIVGNGNTGTITNVYSTGSMSYSYQGAISYDNGNPRDGGYLLSHAYTTGLVGAGVYNSELTNLNSFFTPAGSIISSFGANTGIWSDSQASSYLTGVGSIWTDPTGTSTPYTLASHPGAFTVTALVGDNNPWAGNTLQIRITDPTLNGGNSFFADQAALYGFGGLYGAPSQNLFSATYQWYADGIAIAGANRATLTLPGAYIGKVITAQVHYTNGLGVAGAGYVESISSATINGVSDVAANVSTYLDVIQANHIAISSALTSTGQFSIYDGLNTAVTTTVAQLTSAANAISLIKDHSYLVAVADTAVNISSGIDALISNALAGKIDDLSITDSGVVTLSSSLASSLAGLAAYYGVDLSGYQMDGDVLVNQASDGTVYIKSGGNLTTCSNSGLVFFGDGFTTGSGVIANIAADYFAPFYFSSGGINGYTLPDLYTGPASLGLTYQLIEAAQNAVVTGSIFNEFIKVSNSNSIGKAVNGNGGNDVIDGGVGSTFVTGGDNHNTTFFLDGRAPGTSWSTITDFQAGVDKATIWGFVRGVSSIDTSFTNYNNEGAAGYEGLTLHFKNLLPDGQTSGSNANLNSITFTGYTLQDLGVNSLAELNAQINAGTNPNILVGSTQDSAGTHSYLYIC